MSLFSDNIKYLRGKKSLTQSGVADDLKITRARLLKYEVGTSQPPIELLKKISNYYHVSIDILVSVDLRKISLDDLLPLGDNRILL
ncbi:helix-turn-helix domain-containing protein [Flavobacterium macacae]|uniref:XRE family transcriptional regulator n=1 Tax=Flavobacterium macacae TaxID=2488993 RepID=A0A3P3VZ59_9FLAO|nr:helix-turn-helix transcriptional regulator [Flavobacterium macacae]RRJ88101.1 XRE family transcriptional regulator [Flavobacterium macacae]